MLLTPAAVQLLDDIALEVNNYAVTVTLLTPKKLVATVVLSSKRFAIVSLSKKMLATNGEVSRAVATCTICRKYEDTGLLCPEMVAAVLNSQSMKPFGSHWSLYLLEFATEVRHTSTWVEQLHVHIPLFPYVPDSSVEHSDNILRSWRYPPPKSGRKTALQTDRKRLQASREALLSKGSVKGQTEPHRCIGCEQAGHNLTTCLKIDLDSVHAAWLRQAAQLPRLKKHSTVRLHDNKF